MEYLSTAELTVLLAFIALAATLYSSVGHGGASGYLAAMALFGLAPVFMKPAALAMNIAVAGLVFTGILRSCARDPAACPCTAPQPPILKAGVRARPGTGSNRLSRCASYKPKAPSS